MKKKTKILITGATGFVGSHLKERLNENYTVVAPSRQILDLKNGVKLKEFLLDGKFDIILHAASPSPFRSSQYDSYDSLLKDMLQIFMNFYSLREHYGMLYYCGSGAEYDKVYDMVQVEECKIGVNIPSDDYGFSKYIMNELARNTANIYNFRIFACFGPREYNTKFISYCIRQSIDNEDIIINQNCKFDYLYIDDYVSTIEYFIENKPQYHDYNVCSGKVFLLSDIARMVQELMNSTNTIIVKEEKLNNEYTASNRRLLNETKLEIMPLKQGIKKLIDWEIEHAKKSS